MLLRIVVIIAVALCDEDLPNVTLEDVEYNATNFTTTTSTAEELNLDWLPEAVKDVAYYLRQHKFNEYDRRYQKTATDGMYYSSFPKPPLRSLHWEVHLHCDVSFIHCMEYLNKRVKLTRLRRKDDTSVVITQQNWTTTTHQEQINAVDKDCQDKKKIDDVLAHPFEGPIERFKWRTSASYYLCWYTLNGVPTLEHIGEPCDNFASCLHPKLGAENHDPRANDTVPFSCALYSFCPDPCCPAPHLVNLEECFNADTNPCVGQAHRSCSLPRAQNTRLTDLVLSRWNVSCRCPAGHRWASRFGLCADVNECAAATHTCAPGSEVCVNRPGGFACVCAWGFVWSDAGGTCEESRALQVIKGKFKVPGAGGKFRFSFKEVIRNVFKSRANVCCIDMCVVLIWTVLVFIR